nr:neuronatin isoform X2 [Meriones unguiculatus]
MATVAAASAELLIIGWYIFRVLLQVSVCPGCGWASAPEAKRAPWNPNPPRDCRLPNPTYPNCRDSCLPKCGGGTICPCPFPCPHPRTDPVPSAPAPGREQRLRGAAVARCGRSRPRRCSGTPCRSWRTRCPGPGGRCWGSAGSEPPTEGPAPSPGRPCHQVLLCLSTRMGASAAQEWGFPCAPSSEEHLPRSVRGW